MSKLMAEWFWTDRWMGSSGFLLPLEARGLYREMLTQAWRRGAKLPNDPDAIRRAIGVTLREWKRAWPRVQPYWRVDGDSLVNDTQVEIYAETQAIAEKTSQRAKSAAEARWSARAMPEQCSSTAQAVPEQCPPSPSLYVHPSQKQKDVAAPGPAAPEPTPVRVRATAAEARSKRPISRATGSSCSSGNSTIYAGCWHATTFVWCCTVR